jgi:predicted nucleic acid-binding protein
VIVLDASVLIAHFAVADRHSSRAFEILDTEDELSVHPLTLAEVLVKPAREDRAAIVLAQVDRLGVERIGAMADEPVALAQLRAQTGLRLPDCCVLVAAERTAAAVATFDARLAAVARERGLEVHD